MLPDSVLVLSVTEDVICVDVSWVNTSGCMCAVSVFLWIGEESCGFWQFMSY